MCLEHQAFQVEPQLYKTPRWGWLLVATPKGPFRGGKPFLTLLALFSFTFGIPISIYSQCIPPCCHFPCMARVKLSFLSLLV